MKEKNFQKHTLNLMPGDFEKLQRFYPDIGASAVIRTLVHNHVKKIERDEKPLEGVEVAL